MSDMMMTTFDVNQACSVLSLKNMNACQRQVPLGKRPLRKLSNACRYRHHQQLLAEQHQLPVEVTAATKNWILVNVCNAKGAEYALVVELVADEIEPWAETGLSDCHKRSGACGRFCTHSSEIVILLG